MDSKSILVVGITFLFIILMSIGCVENQQRKFGDMKLSSSEFENNKPIPSEYTCDGADVSSPLFF